MTVKAVKLVSGEELVGDVVYEEPDHIVMQNVLAIMLHRTQDGNLNVGFVPFAPYLGKGVNFEFKLDKLLFVKEVDDQMKNQYNSIFGGVVVPPKTLIVG